MKKKVFIAIWLVAGIFLFNDAAAQSTSPYQLPDSYRFDYEVTQMILHKKNVSDTSIIHFYYTKSGEYGAAKFSIKGNPRRNLTVIFTGDGTSIIINEHRKQITIFSIRKLISDFSEIAKWIKVDSLIANMRKKSDGKEFQSVKTGKSKQIDGYSSEEYSISDGRGSRGSVWCAKVDFNTQIDYILDAFGGNLIKMMSARMNTHPLLQTLMQPKTLVTDIETKDSANGHEFNMHTVVINQTSTTISTTGYSVNNYSNMSFPEIFRAAMNKRID